jgi:hypothetical protein
VSVCKVCTRYLWSGVLKRLFRQLHLACFNIVDVKKRTREREIGSTKDQGDSIGFEGIVKFAYEER